MQRSDKEALLLANQISSSLHQRETICTGFTTFYLDSWCLEGAVVGGV